MQLLLNDDAGMELQHVAVSTLNFLDLVSGPAYITGFTVSEDCIENRNHILFFVVSVLYPINFFLRGIHCAINFA